MSGNNNTTTNNITNTTTNNTTQNNNINFGPSADDRETLLKALEDILPIINAIVLYKQCSFEDIQIYDPYYCNGNIKLRLQSLGLNINSIQNDPIDCYYAQKNNLIRPFDLLLSNPPYSGDHIRRCIQYSIKINKPWILLLPSNVMHRPWFNEVIKNYSILYIAPLEKYIFEVNNTNISHVPMVTIWFLGIPPQNNDLKEKILEKWNENNKQKNSRSSAVLAQSFDELPRKIKKLLPFTQVELFYYFHYYYNYYY